MTQITAKAKRFNAVLLSVKKALDSIGIPFHLHSGTALGAHREKTFIEHDDDIDIAVFHKDVNTPEQVKDILAAVKKQGFEVESALGRLARGKEIQLTKNGIGLDIFWVYEGEYRGKEYHLVSSYFGSCDELPHKSCVWGYRPYEVQKIKFLGETYNVLPKQTLEDAYGKGWRIPKKFSYHEGLESGYTSLIKDYYKPVDPNVKIAFCFMLMDNVVNGKMWERFFNQDNYPVKPYNIYAHLARPSDKHPSWIQKGRIPTIKTGWCEENLLKVWVNLLKKAYKDPTNKYFALLSGDCIPLYDFWEVFRRITRSTKSRVNYKMTTACSKELGLYYADQWMILNRKCAKILISIMETKEGTEFRKELRARLLEPEICHCPDELFPMAWFVKKLGPVSSPAFKKEIRKMETTYTHWLAVKDRPMKISNFSLYKMTKKAICGTDAVFGRKFTSFAADKFAMTCGDFA